MVVMPEALGGLLVFPTTRKNWLMQFTPKCNNINLVRFVCFFPFLFFSFIFSLLVLTQNLVDSRSLLRVHRR
ncbi:hypothetical protein L6452_04437 [Arctium lappa]|uniref:Uncharacterized protein n=1 Tax=Arctium lappa TaxID=4217 RepID=A0ACB9EE03_ARCLA|nr:hypothetical protein L6452_04437 [Arctium lappa]